MRKIENYTIYKHDDIIIMLEEKNRELYNLYT